MEQASCLPSATYRQAESLPHHVSLFCTRITWDHKPTCYASVVGRAFRFRAPPVAVSAELSWLLRRAFGPENPQRFNSSTLDVKRVLDVGARLDLLHRIAARTPHELLAEEIGEETTTQIFECFEHTAVQSNCLLKTAGDIGLAAEKIGIPIIFLKGVALHLAGHTRPGERAMGDVDVLARDADARALQKALLAQGYREVYEGEFSEEQQGHLPCLGSPHGQGAEIHSVVKHVHIEGDRSATAEDLLHNSLTQPAPGLPDNCFLPHDDLLTAHILVHGLVRHGAAPHIYPPARVIGDIQDLGFDESRWRQFKSSALGWIDHAVRPREIRAVADLVSALAGGVHPKEVVRQGGDPAHLLRHLAAIADWPGYADVIRLQNARAQSWRTLLWPDKDRVVMELGEDSSPMRRLGWRLWRPFRITGKLIRVGVGQIGAHLTNKR